MRQEQRFWPFPVLWTGILDVGLAACLVILVAGGVLAQQGDAMPRGGYNLSWWTVDGGGGSFSSGPGYSLGGTLGQPDAGVLNGPGYTLTGGLWRSGADEIAFPTLIISYAGNGGGLVSLNPPGGLYGYGTVVTLAAVPDPGSSFTGWSGDVVGTANPITLTMDVDKAVTATFVTYRVYVPLIVRHAP